MSLAQFLDEEELNPHEAAWRSRNWDAVDELVKEFTKNNENEMFEVLNQLNDGKKNMDVSLIDSYQKSYVDLAMSQHADTLYSAYVMNLVGHGLTNQAHYDYYLLTVRKSKRYGAWAKLVQEKTDDLIILRILEKRYFINTRVATEYRDQLIALNMMDQWKKKNKAVALALVDVVFKTKTDQKAIEKLIQKW
ncbi:clamp-loader subunit [Pectobacterium phage POP12]|nr:clamp-loader subunit [Pectobacterium phage POP12]